MSDNFEEDLTAICIVKGTRKVAVSTNQGIINLFTWDWFGDCDDRITGHPNSVDTMIKYDEDTLITGAEDGLVRAVSVHPNKIIAILGGDEEDADDEGTFYIQKVTLSHDKKFVASCSLDDVVKIFDVSDLNGRIKEEYNEEEDKARNKNMSSDDDDWESQDDEDDDDEDMKEEKMQIENQQKKSKTLNIKKNNLKRSKKMQESEKKKQFFSNM